MHGPIKATNKNHSQKTNIKKEKSKTREQKKTKEQSQNYDRLIICFDQKNKTKQNLKIEQQKMRVWTYTAKETAAIKIIYKYIGYEKKYE